MIVKGDGRIRGNPVKILVIQLGDIGDIVLSTPCFRALRETYPDARIVAAVHERGAELVKDFEWLDGVIAIRRASGSLWNRLQQQSRFLRDLRQYGFDLAIDLRTGERGALLSWLSGAPQRLSWLFAVRGFCWRNQLFTDLLHLPYDSAQHVVDYFLRLLAAYGITTLHTTPTLVVTSEKQERVQRILEQEGVPSDKPLIALQPFSLWSYKELSKEKYIALARQLRDEYDCSVVITGSPSEAARAGEIVQACGQGCFNLAGRTSIDMYAALLHACRMFVGIDSAGLHIAAAVDTPTVGIFGPSSARSWAPRGESHLVVQKELPCVPCRKKGCDNTEYSRCLDLLTVGEIFLAIRSLMANGIEGRASIRGDAPRAV